MRFYLGLATPSTIRPRLVGPDGTLLFAEATERSPAIQAGANCEPDAPAIIAPLLREFVPPGREIVVASSWGEQFSGFLKGQAHAGTFDLPTLAAHPVDLNASFVPEQAERVFIADLHLAQQRAGLGTPRPHPGRAHRRQPAPRAGRRPAALSAPSLPRRLRPVGKPLRGGHLRDRRWMGETGASAIHRLKDGQIEEVKRHRGRGSLGFLYGLITDLAGFDQVKGEEWKIMGLAPYGRPDPDLAAILARLYRVEGTRLRFADAQRSAASPPNSWPAAPPMPSKNGWADLARCGQDLFGTLMDVLVAEAHALAPPKTS